MAKNTPKTPKYHLNAKGEFIIENYNFSKPLANFFPGIAGKYGIPMWVFYVNRAQGIASFGTKDKNHAILEFQPANKAWQSVSSQGFRTFIKVTSGKEDIFYEPFHNGFANLDFTINNRMKSSAGELILEEENQSLGLGAKIEYFTIPNESFAALVRSVTLRNLSAKSKRLQILDGLPQIIPYGTTNLFLKKLHRTIEAWMHVENLDKDVPFYKLDVDPTDRPEVIYIEEGNFYLGFHYRRGNPEIIKPIVDPQTIFGPVTDFACPYKFIAENNFKYPKEQITKNKTPCGFLLLNLNLAPKGEKTFYAIVGYMRNLEVLNELTHGVTEPGYLEWKRKDNQRIIGEIKSDIATISSSKEFNLYSGQTYLDNVIRGGYPVIFKANSASSIFYLYSRKHGDLERDYNKFQIQASYFSQGNGNYRDVNQNRRNDVWFNPEIKDENILTLLSLIQADGFNPLVVKGLQFLPKEGADLKSILRNLTEDEEVDAIISFMNKPFTPGEIILFIEENRIKLKVSYDDFLNMLLSQCVNHAEAQHGEGFWTDHWVYNLDLIESYLGIYPENFKQLLFERKDFTFYDNAETIRPRSEKYVLHENHPRQFKAVAVDDAKSEIIRKRPSYAHVVRTQYGQGQIYRCTLINKLLCLAVNKLASLDPFGIGIEMEANKPDWYDALNGLPGLFGSSLNETLELKRLLLFIKNAVENSGVDKIYVTEEIYNFLTPLNGLIADYLADTIKSTYKDYHYWDKSYALKEEYREKTKFGFEGRESELSTSQLMEILHNALRKIDIGIAKAKHRGKELYDAYFINQPLQCEIKGENSINPIQFRQVKLPLFFEAQVHALKLNNDKQKARAIYKDTKASELYDKKLKMYKVTASLQNMPFEIGRCRAFTPGWLENESIWLHMEYKYLLELLKNGLYREFYEEFKNVLIPFQKPERYGRSILENSSFLVSSAFPDKSLHGNGFVARLSGSTAEFLQIWLTMNMGLRPFSLDAQDNLNLKFAPILPGWLFTKQGGYSFNFLSKIKVIYHNPKRKDTFGNKPAKPIKITLNDREGNAVEINGDTIAHPYAHQVRSRQIGLIEVQLA